MNDTLRDHWDDKYASTGPTQVSWFQPTPGISVQLISKYAPSTDTAILDAGGGASTLVDALLGRGYSDITVLDLSQTALDATRERLGPTAHRQVKLLRQDLLSWQPPRHYDIWHDRAVFHFLTDDPARAAYLDVMRAATKPGSHVILGAFAADGPEYCSGLPVSRYDRDRLAATIGDSFTVLDTRREEHTTPSGTIQPFTWLSARRDL